MFIDQDAQSPWSRAANFGLRCIQSIGKVPADAERVLSIPARDYSKERPASDEVFRAFLSAYAYDKTPLNAEMVSRDSSPRTETIKETAAWLNRYLGEPQR